MKEAVRTKRGRRPAEGAVPSSTFIVTYRRNLRSQVLIGAGARGVAICEDSSGETVALSQIGPSVAWLNGKIKFRSLGLQCQPLLVWDCVREREMRMLTGNGAAHFLLKPFGKLQCEFMAD